MTTTAALVTAVVVLVVILAVGWAVQTANRLDRLNVRVEKAWQSLEAALERRTVVARTIAAWMIEQGDNPAAARARELVTVADHADQAPPDRREEAENEVSAALARIDDPDRPQALVIELADAETRVMMARRFYNDAIRDTRSLADRRLVRWLRLAGTATVPNYFEIVERGTPGTSD
ncbi:hypothetical protein GCM10009624_10800 [Gordonia sinesedis]